MKIYKIYLLIIIVILLTACKENPTEQLFELNALLTEEMVNAVNMDQGVRVDSFNLKGGIVCDYTISIPEIHDGDDVPLIIGLHWYGEKEGEQYLRCLADPGFKKLNAIEKVEITYNKLSKGGVLKDLVAQALGISV